MPLLFQACRLPKVALADFRNSDVYLVVDDGTSGQCAAKIDESVHHIHFLALDCEARLNVRFPEVKI